ncbi:gfo/Idh/MocA family oxidoreductase [Pelomyxa schiedti]|nr:gfo/Idh/MocA family oxidoreductase [Pelomyxa schiedti]
MAPGVGVVGLHEGATMVVALASGRVPPRSAVLAAACDPDPGKVAAAARAAARAARGDDAAAVDGARSEARARRERAARSAGRRVNWTTSYEEMLRDERVQIVAIYTPDHMHAQHIVQAFAAGKHVVCAKPLVNSVEGARKLVALLDHPSCKLLVGQSTRFFEPFQRQRRAFESGHLGEIEMIDAHYIHRMDWFYEKSDWSKSKNFDWVFGGLSHPLDLVCWYIGKIKEVSAVASKSHLAKKYGVETKDIYVAHLVSFQGKIARVMGHYGLKELPSARNSIECVIYGSRNTSMAQYHDMGYYYTQDDGTEVKEDPLYEKRSFYFNNEVHGMHYGEFANYVDYFSKFLQNPSESGYSPNLREGLELFCVMEALRCSANNAGTVVQVDKIRCDIGLKTVSRL